MPTTRGSRETPFAGLYALPPSRLPYQANVLVRSFLIQRPAGNVLVYNSPAVNADAEAIRGLGGATRLLINHHHEAMYGAPRSGTPTFVHERDSAATARSMPVAGTFSERAVIDGDLEVIPAPGHTPGSTCYLWDSGEHRVLFTGDTLWVEYREWKAVVLDPGSRADYLDSLATLREVDFDILVPWGVGETDPYCFAVDESDARSRIDDVIRRLRSGSDR